MRLYSQVGADSHVDPEYGRFTPDDAGGFDFPDEISDVLGGFAVKGKRLWETETERADRLHGMEMARRRDPASMLAVMEDNQAVVRQLAELTAHLAAQRDGTLAAAEPALTALAAQVEALTGKLAEMEARSAPSGDTRPEPPEGDGSAATPEGGAKAAAPKPSRPAKSAAAKPAA